MKQTKIVCSISDFRCDVEFLRKLFFEGMNVVRMNTAHATKEGMTQVIKNVRAVSPHIGILIDTKGPEVRSTTVKEPISYKTGDVVKIFGRPEMESTHDIVNVSVWPSTPITSTTSTFRFPPRTEPTTKTGSTRYGNTPSVMTEKYLVQNKLHAIR